jgi:Domain of unknown function DUF11/PASTA domain
MQRLALAGVAAAAALSMLTGVAGASTFALGSTAEPNGASPQACITTGVFAQSAGDPSMLYTLPAGGQITQWQTNTAGETAGAAVALVALTPEAGVYRVDAVDDETVPNPAGGVATFTPASAMMVSTGDILGLVGGSGVTCYWSGGSTPLDDVSYIFGTTVVNPGDAFSPLTSGPFAVNVAATLVASEDSAVTTAVEPGSVAAGGAALLASSVTDNGPASNPLTFTDSVPAGLTIDAVLSPSGPCTTLGQVVTCTISGLGAGQSAPVDIVVTAPGGTYTNPVNVAQASAVTDPVTGNNAAAAAFTAVAPTPATPATTKCVVTSLANVPLGTAKKLLAALSCKVGKVTKSYSSKVAKGDVIKTTPGSGSYTAPKSIGIVESSGPKPKKHHKTKKK